MRDIEDPVITRMERYGMPEEKGPRCPCCGGECETVYTGMGGEIVGCENCLVCHDAWDTSECYEEDDT